MISMTASKMCEIEKSTNISDIASDDLMDALNEVRTSINEFSESVISILMSKESMRQASAWLTTEEATQFLGISERTLYRYRIQNLVEHKKVGKAWYYRNLISLIRMSNNKIREIYCSNILARTKNRFSQARYLQSQDNTHRKWPPRMV